MAQHATIAMLCTEAQCTRICLPCGNQVMASVHAQAQGILHMTPLHPHQPQKCHAHLLYVLQAAELPEAAAGSDLQQASTKGAVLTDSDSDTMLAELHQVLHSQEAVPQPQVTASSSGLAMPHLLACRCQSCLLLCVL